MTWWKQWPRSNTVAAHTCRCTSHPKSADCKPDSIKWSAGLAERERLRDLFGRHVGADVARHALQQDPVLLGDIREVAILLVDIVGSTALAAARPPREVAEILNDFFRIVVGAVDDRQGLINKFQGDAALAVFGAPLRIEAPASAALATARALAAQLRKLLPTVDFGVGVSVGSVFAGNVGAEHRYEYTVIGDPVNEAARLADYAKHEDSRILASGSAIARASAVRAPALGAARLHRAPRPTYRDGPRGATSNDD